MVAKRFYKTLPAYTVSYAMIIGEGASENDIKVLPKYRYRLPNTLGNDKKQEEDCCVYLYKYMDGAELCTLSCNHHFHHKCTSKWLQISATCPLCKLKILKGKTLV
ncbi:E3 ubiquitin protein ligase RIE1-like [Olea europaea var. sylvestris]|uniref:RING-type E3 ubiquitin transferase n=1 Tax=Olea europaea subsp. europaea TaxID=158383 RepID=A0A8S0TXB3_OLEEU|nr:E3 ubiquitin protein ligase RIE1-like [Olea europaea var. sylvestris]XP_022846496.1 E3 ubiquitin protein ligase RIE1-like [Olea europaea var. sylvestris]XP_022846500.1 E3 ubiquitin protein ligase RIE1-like [Olea europaea var. sylvestris]XP_022846508.1 E3 ubiquitin protein ligase RIE1-like [Olea europaea var. sylvestris]CAA3008151.1 E3 ubiquitin ligase RIE1-like [Olea europaea subsp. europaea]